MKKLLSIFVVVLMLMAGTAWAGSSSAVWVDPGATVNTTWSGTNGDFTLNGTMGALSTPNANILVYNAANGAFSGSVGITTDGSGKVTHEDGTIYATTSNVSAMFADGGMANFSLNRLTGDTQQHYADGGQYVYGSAFSSDGSGELSVQTLGTNYAHLTARNTQIQADSADPLTFDGADIVAGFGIQYVISNGSNGASLFNAGTGSSQVSTSQYSTAAYNGASSFTLGSGGGCYTNATVAATGSGQFGLTGSGANSLNAPGFAVTILGGGSFQYLANYNTGLNVADFSVNGN